MGILKVLKSRLNKDLHLKELLSGSVITFVLKITGMLLGYFLIYIISNRIGAEGVGHYNLFVRIITVISTVVCLGLNITSLRYIGQFNNYKDKYKIKILYGHILKLILPISIGVGFLIYFNANFIILLLDKSDEEIIYLKMVGVLLPFFALNKVNIEFIRGFKKLQLSEFIRSVSRNLIIILLLLCFYIDTIQVIVILNLFAFGVLINWILSSSSIFLRIKKIEDENKSSFKIRELVKTSFPIMINSISTVLLISMPIFFLYYYSSQKNVGLFTVAFQITMLISLVMVIINTMLAPKLSELFWKEKYKDLQKLVSQASMIMFWAALILCFCIIIFSDFILGIFGNEFLESKLVLWVLAISQLINAASGSVQILMNMTGEQKKLRSFNLLIVLLSIISYIIVIPKFGLIGCAFVFGAGLISKNILSAIYVNKKLGLKTFYLPFISFKND